MSNKTTKTLSIVLGAAFATTLAASNIANASEAGANPFAMTNLEGGYQVAGDGHKSDKKMEGKCGEGKCGGDKKGKKMEGKCGKDHKKMHDGKCGGDHKKMEGKSGSDKKAKKMEGKCGEGKCGGK